MILPSSPVRPGAERDAFEAGRAWLEARGHEVSITSALDEERDDARLPWLADGDLARAAAWREALASDADIVWMGRGGYGAARMLAALEPAAPDAAFVDRGQRFFGFSDGTALLPRHPRAWSAPPIVQIGRLDGPSLWRLEAALDGDDGRVPPFLLEPLMPTQGAIEGPLVGGNLTVLASLVGTPHLPPLDGLLVLEDVGEVGYRVDRMLHQLLFAGALERVRAVLLGDFSAGLAEREVPLVERALVDFFARLGRPVFRGLPVGHGASNACLPWTRAVVHADGRLEVAP